MTKTQSRTLHRLGAQPGGGRRHSRCRHGDPRRGRLCGLLHRSGGAPGQGRGSPRSIAGGPPRRTCCSTSMPGSRRACGTSIPAPLEGDLAGFLTNLTTFWQGQSGGVFRSLVAEAQTDPVAADALAAYSDGRVVHTAALIERAKARGELRDDVDSHRRFGPALGLRLEAGADRAARGPRAPHPPDRRHHGARHAEIESAPAVTGALRNVGLSNAYGVAAAPSACCGSDWALTAAASAASGMFTGEGGLERGDHGLELLVDHLLRQLLLQLLDRRRRARALFLDLDDVPAEIGLHRVGRSCRARA